MIQFNSLVAKLAEHMAAQQYQLDMTPTSWLTTEEIQEWLAKSLAATKIDLVDISSDINRCPYCETTHVT